MGVGIGSQGALRPGAGAGQSTAKRVPLSAHKGRLRPGELAEAAVLGDLALVLEIVGWFAPLGGALQALAIVPFAVLASRHRLRAGVIAVTSSASVAWLVGGVGIVLQTGLVGAVGLSVGAALRRNWSKPFAVVVTTLSAGLPVAAGTLLVDAISPSFRHLTFQQVRILWRDVAAVLSHLGRKELADRGTHLLNVALAHWWYAVPAAEMAAILAVAIVCVRLQPLLLRVATSSVASFSDAGAEREPCSGEPAGRVAPVPARLASLCYRYPGAPADAVRGVDLELASGEMLAVIGPNGSGKSTLVRLLAGRLRPSGGALSRPGRAGYGERGGTAMIFQRPESQVLGVRVRDDLWWGLAPGDRPAPGPLLEVVGLAGMQERETSTLSGGQMQRLAIAAALAREPHLLISDEATAMLDSSGREEVIGLLRRIAAEGITVVHVTHRFAETLVADRVGRMVGGRLASVRAPEALDGSARPAYTPFRPATPAGEVLVALRGVSYEYSPGTPWAQRALTGVDLEVRKGEGLVVTGANGSGKTTLAWILGGLLEPASGSATLRGEPIASLRGHVAVSFQHARLQLLKPTVLADVAAGTTPELARRALEEVALDPDEIGQRRIDDLSGGEQRRVALAGLIVRAPELLVLDEPYAGLDDEARLALARVLSSLRERRRIATVVVSHDLEDAGLLGERLVLLDSGTVSGEEPIRR